MRALIIGHGGQDGFFLFEQLEAKGYEVQGVGRNSVRSCGLDRPLQAPISLLDRDGVRELIAQLHPDEIYYLAAFHHSSEEDMPDDYTMFERSYAVHVTGLLNVLDAMLRERAGGRLFYAASSHIFGEPTETPQTENTPCRPQSAYALTKFAGANMVRQYRERRGLFGSVGILYTHESERRGPQFLSRRIIDAAIRIRAGDQQKLVLGNISARVDWGFAPEFSEAMWETLQIEQPDDFIIATGESTSIESFVATVFGFFGLNWLEHVVEDPSILRRRAPVIGLVGNPARIRAATGWEARTRGDELARALVRRLVPQQTGVLS